MPKLELFEKIVNGFSVDEAQTAVKSEAEPEVSGNAFEERSKKVKAKINGATNIHAKSI